MKKYIILSLLVCSLFTSCKERTKNEIELDSLGINVENFNRIDTVFYKSKKVKSLRFYKEKAEYVNVGFYESGKKKSIGNVRDSQCHNKYIDWYENGKIKWLRQYNLGIQIGKNIEYLENGNLKQQYDNEKNETTEYWENGKVNFIRDGIKFTQWDENGNLMK